MGSPVLFLSPIYAPVRGGASRYYATIVPIVLDETGAEGVVLTCYAPERPLIYREDGVLFLRLLFAPSSIERSLAKPKLLYNYLVAMLAVVYARLRGVRAVHTHTKRYFSWACRLATWLGVPVVVDGRDTGSPSFPATGERFIAASRNIEREARRVRTEDVVHIPIPMSEIEYDPDTRTADFETHRPYVVFVGDIAERKGVGELLDAFDDFDGDLDLVLVGECIEESLLDALGDDVHYVGTLPHEQVLDCLAAAEFLVLPSREEALGRVVLEATEVGTPAICPPDVPEYASTLPAAVLPRVSAEAIREKLRQFHDAETPPTGYPVDRHYVANVADEYAALYRTLLD